MLLCGYPESKAADLEDGMEKTITSCFDVAGIFSLPVSRQQPKQSRLSQRGWLLPPAPLTHATCINKSESRM
jgi:hypothetical protein